LTFFEGENTDIDGGPIPTIKVNMSLQDKERGVEKASSVHIRATVDKEKKEIRVYLNRMYELYKAVSLTFPIEEVMVDCIVHELETALTMNYMFRFHTNHWAVSVLHKHWRSDRQDKIRKVVRQVALKQSNPQTNDTDDPRRCH